MLGSKATTSRLLLFPQNWWKNNSRKCQQNSRSNVRSLCVDLANWGWHRWEGECGLRFRTSWDRGRERERSARASKTRTENSFLLKRSRAAIERGSSSTGEERNENQTRERHDQHGLERIEGLRMRRSPFTVVFFFFWK